MFKKACFLILLLLLCTSVFSVRLVEPISKELNDKSYVGSVVPGQTLELIVSKELGKFDNLKIKNILPSDFDVKVEDYLESIKIFIKIPKNAPLTDYDLKFTLFGEEEELVDVYFTVDDSLLDSSFLNYSNSVFVNETANYEFLLINNSHADAKFIIKTNLPWYWQVIDFQEIIVEKFSSKKGIITMSPQVQGKYIFESHIIMQNENLEKDFSLKIDSKPTLESKFKSTLNALPFYSISLLPSYLFNALVASLN